METAQLWISYFYNQKYGFKILVVCMFLSFSGPRASEAYLNVMFVNGKLSYLFISREI